MTRSITDPWIRPTLYQTTQAVLEGKRFRNTLLRIIKNIVKRTPVIGPTLVKAHAHQLELKGNSR